MPSGKGGSSSTAAGKAVHANKFNQCNSKHPNYGGHQPGYTGTGSRADLNNHANQLNSNNSIYRPKESK